MRQQAGSNGPWDRAPAPVGVAGAVAAVLVDPAGCAAEDIVAAAVGDAAELLDVDVDQFAGPGAFVAARGFAGGPIAGGQCGQAVPDEVPSATQQPW